MRIRSDCFEGMEPGVNLEYKSGKPRPERILPSPISTAHAEISKDALAMMKSSLGINADLWLSSRAGAIADGLLPYARNRAY